MPFLVLDETILRVSSKPTMAQQQAIFREQRTAIEVLRLHRHAKKQRRAKARALNRHNWMVNQALKRGHA